MINEKRERNRYYDQYVRDKESAAFYHSKEWLVVREQALIRDNYLCRMCLEDSKVFTPATLVHHVIEVKEDWNKRLDLDNLMSICHSCHNKIHNKHGCGVTREDVMFDEYGQLIERRMD